MVQPEAETNFASCNRLVDLRQLGDYCRSGRIDVDEEDSSFAIAAILALGALALFTFPLSGRALHMSDKV